MIIKTKKEQEKGFRKQNKSRLKHECSSVMLVVPCVGTDVGAELIACIGESYRVCACV